jgi:hypothetical protein
VEGLDERFRSPNHIRPPCRACKPGVDDWLLIKEIHGGHDAILEFLFGCDADMAQDGAGELGEEAIDDVEPGAMRGREGEFEAVYGLLREPGFGLFGDARNDCRGSNRSRCGPDRRHRGA